MADVTRLCRRCGQVIPPARLEALPDTTICVQCSRDVGGEFELTVSPDNLGKAGSLKKNYGGWKVRRRQKPLPPLEGEKPADASR